MTEFEEIKSEELYMKFQGILNKLTPQNSRPLAKKLKLDITTEKQLRVCVDQIVSKVS